MSAQRDAMVAEIAIRLAELLPAVEPGTLTDVLAGLRLRPGQAQQLRDHLTTHADALTSGSSDGPAVLLRLLDTLAEIDPQVQRARCVTCEEPRQLRHRAGTGRVCGRCYAATRVERCVRCDEIAHVCFRDEAGGAVCDRCRRRDVTKWEDCSVCGNRAHVYYRVQDRPLCQSCGPRPARPCSSCGRDQPVAANTRDGPLCGRCYRWANATACESCGRLVPNRRRDRATGARVCERCWAPPLAECASCRQVKPCRTNGAKTGRPLCSSCRSRARPRRTCALCGKQQRVHSRLPLGNACGPCYTKIRRWPGECAACGQRRPLIGVDDQQRRICGPCAGDTRKWICRTCGRFAALFADGSCPHCVAHERLRRLLTDPDGRPCPQLAPVQQLLEAEIDADPFTILLWLHRTAWAKLLGELTDAHVEITHAVLDTLPRRRHVHYLRTLLVNTGILPARAEDLESTPAWLEELLASLSPQAARIIRPYATWSVLRRARNRARRRPPTRSVRKYIRGRILLAAGFLAWLEKQSLTLGDVTQAHIDAWLESGSSNHYRLRDFINWARARGLVRNVTIPWLSREDPADILDDDQRWKLLKRCLHDEQIDLPVRAAGALLLLYGQVPLKIVALTTGHITVTDANTYLVLDAQPVLIPPRLADLLTQLAGTRPGSRRPLVEYRGDGGHLLFPGFLPGTAMDHDRLSTALNQQLDLRVRPARNAALCALAADLPAAVLADLLGLHITTAIRWVHLVRRDWTSYLANRKSQAAPSTGKNVALDAYPPADR